MVVGRVYEIWIWRPLAAAQAWTTLMALLRRSMPAVLSRESTSMSMSSRVT
ncbi:hypothetical protein STANM309S_03617 [Streptomyces tanashiensis]